ncbi:hypothetical protein GCM10011581_44190 [Saccharopolyspora subtropica]|uniref:Uncharacterized protein n=1 Tax=Saccharopolyspora thermophila TaxID=89367 RepID=A0A917K6V5_9PSEU|nr:hypothetical protein GCM10011581_44190 [Saccharopolyspora subtropica]
MLELAKVVTAAVRCGIAKSRPRSGVAVLFFVETNDPGAWSLFARFRECRDRVSPLLAHPGKPPVVRRAR